MKVLLALALTVSMGAQAAYPWTEMHTLFVLDNQRNWQLIDNYQTIEECALDEHFLELDGTSPQNAICVKKSEVSCAHQGRLRFDHPYEAEFGRAPTLCEQPWELRIANDLADAQYIY